MPLSPNRFLIAVAAFVVLSLFGPSYADAAHSMTAPAAVVHLDEVNCGTDNPISTPVAPKKPVYVEALHNGSDTSTSGNASSSNTMHPCADLDARTAAVLADRVCGVVVPMSDPFVRSANLGGIFEPPRIVTS